MLAIIAVACCLLLLPVDLDKFGWSLIASALSGANIYFQQTSGYFEQTAIERPLLHLWSLGVEEQFYLLAPAVLWVLHRFSRKWLLPAIAVGGIFSFALSVLLVTKSPNAAFYLLPTRAWELLLGVFITGTPSSWLSQRAVREAVAAIGAVAIAIAILAYQPDTPFPGFAALLPCLGTAAIIAAGVSAPTAVGRALRWRPLIGTGLISFSLYLWHWPLIVLAHYAMPMQTLTWPIQVALLGMSYALAYGSWRWIENPCRKAHVSTGVAFALGGGAMAALAGVGLALVLGKGLPQRYPAAVVRIASYLAYDPHQRFRENTCFLRPNDELALLQKAGCVTLRPGVPNILLLGNSHAAHLWLGLQRAAPDAHILQATASGWSCVPVVVPEGRCAPLWHYIFDEVLTRPGVDLVVISAPWEPNELPALEQTLSTLQKRGIAVLLLGATPQYQLPLPRLLAFARLRNDAALPARFEERSPLRSDSALRRIASTYGAAFFSPHDTLCGGGHCLEQADGAPLQFDVDHLTSSGSLLLAKYMVATPAWRAAIAKSKAVNRPR